MNNKVLLVSCDGLGTGGVQNVMMNIVRNLSCKNQFDVLVFTDEQRYYDEEFLKYGNIYRIPHKKRKIDFYIRFFRILKGTYKILKNGNYNVIHCHNEKEAAICLLAAKLAGIPNRISHSHVNDNLKKNMVAEVYYKLYGFLIDIYATCKIACSKVSADSFFGQKAKYNVIVNPIDLKKLDYKKHKYKESDYINFIHVGFFSDNKNQQFILEVFSKIKRYIPNVHLNLIGFGDEYKKILEEKIHKLGLDESVQILPPDSDVPYLFSQSDYMIFPSKREGLGIALLEAQAMGVKCFVSSTVPFEADAGLCEFYDLEMGSEVWAERIVKYIREDRPRTYVDMSKYDIDNICRIYEKIYNGESL